MGQWSARIEATGPGPYDADWASDILEALEQHGPAMSVTPHEVGLTFDVQAATAEDAAIEALRIFRGVLPDLTPVAVQVQTVEEQERQLQESNVPELLGVAELAEALGVSRQRVSELTDSEDFPAPLARLRSGPVWQRSSLGRFMARWPRKPGRPPKTKAVRQSTDSSAAV